MNPHTDPAAQSAIGGHAHRFSHLAAKSLPADSLADPVTAVYFQFFLHGAIEGLAETLAADNGFGDATRFELLVDVLEPQLGDRIDAVATAKMLTEAADTAAADMRAEGRRAVQAWHEEGDADAPGIFLAIHDDPERFPRQIKPE